MGIVKLSTSDPESITKSLEILKKGEILLFPTETVYGLGVDSENPLAIEHLYELKGRPKLKPFQWLVHERRIARERSTGWDDSAEKLSKKFWPGAMTLVIPTDDSTTGWRIPDHEWLLRLLKALNRPLVATSANLSGEAAAVSCNEALEKLKGSIHFAIDGGKTDIGTASTVVKIDDSGVQILRQGAILEKDILDAVKL